MLKKSLGTLAFILLLVGIAAYANGWIVFQSAGDSTTIELKTNQMKDAAESAIEKGRSWLESETEKEPDPDRGVQPATDPDQ